MSNLNAYLDELRSRVDIVELIRGYLPLKPSGSNLKGLCPFHQEKTPSFMVSPGKQIFHCFGCGKGGDAVKFVMEIESLTFREALVQLARQFGLPLPRFDDSPDAEEAGAREKKRQALLAICAAAEQFYAAQLLTESGTPARRYLEERDVSREMWEKFRLGWAPGTWQALYDHLRRQNFSDDLMIEAGLCKKSETGRMYDMLVGRVIFPLQDQAGQPVAFAGRVMDGSEPKYLNSPQTALYNKSQLLYGLYQGREALREKKEALILEGYLDVITAHQYGFANTLATCGTAMTEEHTRRLKRHAERTTLLFDADEAGQKATLRGIELLLAGGHQAVKVCRLTKGEDPDSFLRKFGAEAFAERLAGAADYYHYLRDFVRQEFPLNRPEGKEQAVQFLKPYLLAVRSDIIRSELVRMMADALSVREDLIWKQLKPPRQAGRKARGEAAGEGREGTPAAEAGGDLDDITERARCHRDLMVMKILLEHPDFRHAIPLVAEQEGFWEWFEDQQVAEWVERFGQAPWRHLSLHEILQHEMDEANQNFLRQIAVVGEIETLDNPAVTMEYMRTCLKLLEFDWLTRQQKNVYRLLEDDGWKNQALVAKYHDLAKRKRDIRHNLSGKDGEPGS